MSDLVTPEILTSTDVEVSTEDEMHKLRTECSVMVKYLKHLERKEAELVLQNEILAREAVVNGFDISALEPAALKRRKTIQKKHEDA
ncbi:hypothetical protein FisN_4Hu147 [Fistulifera solaris]|uniref:Uncharacterized protein n=1 Tax=Fistulifera solaris TaxID=1519565 RepID=A0A1Z5JAH7_FISSO|nr:hypothetical protein FisN_4Hu147 [Fistulifera solaris]|eukprot:GAX10902.1 hypothetical protein FisN_4Hu147 [Fistulifera solaris]